MAPPQQPPQRFRPAEGVIHDTKKRGHFHRDARGTRGDTPFALHSKGVSSSDIQSGLREIGVSLSDGDITRLVRLGGSKALESIVNLGQHVNAETLASESPARSGRPAHAAREPKPPSPKPRRRPSREAAPSPERHTDDIPMHQHAGVEYGHAMGAQAPRLSTGNGTNDSSVVQTLLASPAPRQADHAPAGSAKRKQATAQRILRQAVGAAVEDCRWEGAFAGASGGGVTVSEFRKGLDRLGVAIGHGDFRRLVERVGGPGEDGLINVGAVPAVLGVETHRAARSAAPGPLDGSGPPEDVHPKSHLPKQRQLLREQAAVKRDVYERLALRHADDPASLKQTLLRACAVRDSRGKTTPASFRRALQQAGAPVGDADWAALIKSVSGSGQVDVPAFVRDFASHVATSAEAASAAASDPGKAVSTHPTSSQQGEARLRRRVRDQLPGGGQSALQQLRAADGDNDGFVSREAITSVLESQGMRLCQADADELVSSAPCDAEGRVHYVSLLRQLGVPAAQPRSNASVRTEHESRQHAVQRQVFETLARQDMEPKRDLRSALGGRNARVTRKTLRSALSRVGVRLGEEDYGLLADAVFSRGDADAVASTADVIDAISAAAPAVGPAAGPASPAAPATPSRPAAQAQEAWVERPQNVSRHVVREKMLALRPNVQTLFRTLEGGRSGVVELGELRRALSDRCGLSLTDGAFEDFLTNGGRTAAPSQPLDYNGFSALINPETDSRADAFERAGPAVRAPRHDRSSVSAGLVSDSGKRAWEAQAPGATPAGGSSARLHQKHERSHIRPSLPEASELLSPESGKRAQRRRPLSQVVEQQQQQQQQQQQRHVVSDEMGALLRDPPKADRLCTQSASTDARDILGASGRRGKGAHPDVRESLGGGAAATPVKSRPEQASGGTPRQLSFAAAAGNEPVGLAGVRAGVTTAQRDRDRHIRTYAAHGSSIFSDLQYPSQ